MGTGENAERITYSLLSDQGFGYKVLGFFGAKPGDNFKWNYLGSADMLEKYVEQNDVDEIYFAVDSIDEDCMADVIRIAEKRNQISLRPIHQQIHRTQLRTHTYRLNTRAFSPPHPTLQSFQQVRKTHIRHCLLRYIPFNISNNFYSYRNSNKTIFTWTGFLQTNAYRIPW